MNTKENSNTPVYVSDYERIADKIVKVLFENGVTYRDAEVVLDYVRDTLRHQRVQDIV